MEVDLIERGRYLSRITSAQTRKDHNGEIYFALVYGRIVEGPHKGECWMDVLRPAHTIPAWEKMSKRKLDQLLRATGAEAPEQTKGRQVIVRISVRQSDRGAENIVTGYWSPLEYPAPDIRKSTKWHGGEAIAIPKQK
jgi:hypothetical protein